MGDLIRFPLERRHKAMDADQAMEHIGAVCERYIEEQLSMLPVFAPDGATATHGDGTYVRIRNLSGIVGDITTYALVNGREVLVERD